MPMGRTPGWMVLVATMLEVCTLQFIEFVTEPRPAAAPGEPGAPAAAGHTNAEPLPVSLPADPAPPPADLVPPPAEPAPAPAEPSPVAAAPLPAEPSPPEPPPRPVIVEPPHFTPQPVAPPAPVPAPRGGGETPRFLLEVADRTAQIMRAESRLGTVFAGFYPDGSVRFVGSDGVGYEGRSENAVALLTEHGGTRSVRMQVGVSPESKLQITVHGGLHDGETLELEMIAERLSR